MIMTLHVAHQYRDFTRIAPMDEGRARCSCGWESRLWLMEHIAFADFLEHKRAHS